ncbi:MAG: short-chain fatty acid transporter [Defluviitaleaceae bacterium]|nr:short-chain fatty acid transporter [Defluviitaleaceae bacterium]
MFQKFVMASVKLVQRWLPDPFLFAIILTFITFAMGLILTAQTPMQMIGHWGSGFWGLLAFSMQMVLILVTGHTLAQAPIFKKILRNLASIPNNAPQAIMLVTFVAGIASWVNWGFGLVLGALFAKEIAKRSELKCDYRLLIASAYSAFMLWHAGLSSSAGLMMASAGTNFEVLSGGVLDGPVATATTLFAPFTIIMVFFFLITLPLINRAMIPKNDKDVVLIDPSKLEEDAVETARPKADMTPAERLENSSIVSYAVGLMGIIVIVTHFMNAGFSLDLNIVNFIFLMAGIILHGTPAKFLKAVATAVKGAGGIVVQFPFYAGISGMIVGVGASGLSLANIFSDGFVSLATATTLPMFTFLSAGLLNMFVPSGGGQWVIQAPIMLPAAYELGASIEKVIMAYAWGDVWTNMLQPFWALPALAIAGLNAKDVMGFLVVHLIYIGIACSVLLTVL